jgi:hypothetical protein
MSRQTVFLAALGGFALALAPLAYANAQSGDAVAHAERTCLDYGIGPNAAGFETCVDRAAFAYDRGEPDVADQQAATVRNAQDICRSYGLAAHSMGYRQCMANEMERRVADAERINFLTVEQPHRGVVVDDYGFQYDSDGNLLDPKGYVIRYVPR